MPRTLLASLLLLLLTAFAAPAASADTFVVNATDDGSGSCTTTHCTLRQAITAANALPGADVINFDLPVITNLICQLQFFCRATFSTNPIVLATQLPDITGPVTIDGRTQPRFSSTPMVEIRGPGPTVDGLRLAGGSDKSVIRSLAITNFRFGIVIASSTNLIAGSRIGIDMSGTARGNTAGVVIQGDNNQIGGSSTNGDGNVISASTSDGVVICLDCGRVTRASGTDASNNLVLGNLIGTDASGTRAVGNNNGVSVLGRGFSTQFNLYLPGVGDNVIGGGGLTSDYRNVISGNRASGVLVRGTSRTLVGGNLIGVNAAGSAAVGNASAGITLDDAPSTTIGNFGTVTQPCLIGGRPAQCPLVFGGPNTISGNTADGIRVFNTFNTHDVAILGNNIGTNAAASAAIANGDNGVNLTGVNSAANNRIGASGSKDANVIAFNGDAGVRVTLAPSAGFGPPSIRFNKIFSNTGLGIDEGVSPTNGPSISSVVTTDTTTTIRGDVNHGPLPGTITVTLDFYSSSSCDPSGFGEGATFIGSTTATSTSSPPFTAFTAQLNVPLEVGSIVTATQSGGGTSMFSGCAVVTSSGATGTFALTPRTTGVAVGETLNAELVWSVPAPRVWRNLATIDMRLLGEDGQTVAGLHWDEAANTFGLVVRGAAFVPGSSATLENEWLSVNVASAAVVGSGPTGQSVRLALPLRFKPLARGHLLRVEVSASDDLGRADAFVIAGDWHVEP